MKSKDLSRLKTVIFGYLWVAYADGDIASEEVSKFHAALDSAKIPIPTDDIELQHMFDDARDFFHIKFDEASKEARHRMENLEPDKAFAEQLISVCRQAVIADLVLEKREELVLASIGKIVGVDKA